MERKYKKIYEFKQILKQWAEAKRRRNRCDGDPKECMNEVERLSKESDFEFTTRSYSGNVIAKYNIRHAYVAYGLLRGKQYIQIERPRKQNELTESEWKDINKMILHFTENVEEPVNA